MRLERRIMDSATDRRTRRVRGMWNTPSVAGGVARAERRLMSRRGV